MKLDPNLKPHTKVISKQIKGLIAKLDTLKFVEETPSRFKEFLKRIPIAWEMIATINKWDCVKSQSFFIGKETITQ